MKKAKFKSRSPRAIGIKMYEKISEGWAVVKHPKMNWFGTWCCTMGLSKGPH